MGYCPSANDTLRLQVPATSLTPLYGDTLMPRKRPALLTEQHTEKKRRKRSRVSFFPTTFCYPSPHLDVTPNDTWYSRAELELWRDVARATCRQLRHSHRYKQRPPFVWINTDPATRGFEQRSCLERQRRRWMVFHAVLPTHRDTTTTASLADVLEKSTRYASQLAVAQAAWDYQEVYGTSDGVERTEIDEDPERKDPTIRKACNTMYAGDRVGGLSCG